jgi:hypothetical protein
MASQAGKMVKAANMNGTNRVKMMNDFFRTRVKYSRLSIKNDLFMGVNFSD